MPLFSYLLFLYCLSLVLVVCVCQNLEDGHKEDLYIQKECAVVDVPNVKSDPFVPLDVFPAVDLCPACDARSHFKHPEFFLGVLVDRPGMVGERRARADEAHIAFQNIDGLRQLVDRRGADDPSDLRHAAVAFAAVYAGAGMLCIDHH